MICGCNSHNGLLTAKGLVSQAAQQYSLEGLAPRGELEYLDRVGSVSGLRRDEELYAHDDDYMDQQYRRFANGS